METVSVLLVNWNGKKYLEDCLADLLKQDYPSFDIVVADNGSSDGSIEFIKSKFPKEIKSKKIKLILFKKNFGFSKTANQSYKKIDADFVFLFNNDTKIPSKTLIRTLVNSAKKNNAAIVGGNELPFNQKDFKEKEIFPTINILLFNSSNGFRSGEETVTGGACLLVDKRKIGNNLFPEEYFAYGEDTYLSLRTILRGYKCVYEKKARYLHLGFGSSGRRSAFVRTYSERNRLVNLLIFYEKKTLKKLAPLFMFEFFIKSIYVFFNMAVFWAHWRAIFWAIKNKKFILRERQLIQRERKFSDDKIIKLMSHGIFPNNIQFFISSFLNKLVNIYCTLFNLETHKNS